MTKKTAIHTQCVVQLQVLAVFLGCIIPPTKAVYSACSPNERCLNNRVCNFGSQAAYAKVATHLYEITGCANCQLDCGGTCACTASSQVQFAIANSNVSTANASKAWCNHPICKQHLTHHALQYTTYNYPCETSFADAQEQIIKLCGRISGTCCQGKCNKHWEIDQPEPRCETYTSHAAAVRWLFSAYVIIIVVLWQWSTEMDIDDAIKQQLEA